MINDLFIQARNSIINRITGVHTDLVLNASRISLENFSSRDAAAEVKMAMDQFKMAAMDENGYKVNYAELRGSRAYDEYRNYCSPRLRNFDPALLNTQGERFAFWINLYNALVLDGVINFKVNSSVTETRLGIFSFFRKAAYNAGGERLSLDDIEHGLLRANRGFPYLPGPHFASNDPRLEWAVGELDNRVHFALNCASRSCPPIRVYTPELIDGQLDMASRNFVDGSTRIDPASSKLVISAIFNWYKGDFGSKEGVIDFILKHLPDDDRRQLIEEDRRTLRLSYEPYDWGLNTYIKPQGDLEQAQINEIAGKK